MLPETFERKRVILFLRVEDVMMMAKKYPLKEFEILVISRDIIASNKITGDGSIRYTSVFDNVEYLYNVVPRKGIWDCAYGKLDREQEQFIQMYDNQLVDNAAFSDLVALVDMVVNDQVPVIIVHSNLDLKTPFVRYLRDFLKERFRVNTYDMDDLLDESMDVTDIGNVEEIQKLLEEYKLQLVETGTPEDFFNFLTDSLIGKYRKLLEKKTPEELYSRACQQGIYVRKKASKEEMIDTILRKYKG